MSVHWKHLPSQKHSDVHCKLAFLHLHLALHPFLQQQCKTSWQIFDASCICIHDGWYPSFPICHPQHVGFGSCMLVCNACCHTKPAWNIPRFTCCRKESSVGGRLSTVLPFFVNKYFRNSLTLGKERNGKKYCSNSIWLIMCDTLKI